MSETRDERSGMAEKSRKNRFYRFVRSLGSLVLRTLIPVRYHGTENIPEEAPYIVISNHWHALDPLAVAVKLKKTEVVFLGKKEVAESRIGKWFCEKMRMIPVDRHNNDLAAMRSCMKVVREKGVLGIFPEGTRHHEGIMEHIESGTAMIALRGKVPLLPVLINGKLSFFKKTHVYYGKLMDISDLCLEGVSNETAEKLNRRIMDTYVNMLKTAEK